MLITFPLYVLRELGKYFGMSLLIYAFVFLAIDCGLLLREGATFITTLRLLPMVFPLITPLALPLSVITGILICYGRLSSNNEFVGSQAGGIHPGWVALPAITVAFLASLVTVYLNADLLSSAVNNIERSLLKDKANILRAQLTRPGSFSMPISRNQSIAMYRLPDSGIDFTIFRKVEEGQKADDIWDPAYPYPEMRILAKDHSFDVNEDEEGTMKIVAAFVNPSQYSSSGTNSLPGESSRHVATLEVPKTGLNMSISKDRTQYMGIDRLKQQLNLTYENINKSKEEQIRLEGNVIAGFIKAFSTSKYTGEIEKLQKMASAGLDSSNQQERLEYLHSLKGMADSGGVTLDVATIRDLGQFAGKSGYITELEHDTLRYIAEINNKLVMSFACISFAIIGIPLALMLRRGSSMIGFVIGLSFAFAFYMVLTALNGAVRDGSIPWWGLWLPNIFVLFAGILLWRHSQKELR